MKKQLEWVLVKIQGMRDTLQDRIDTAGDGDAAQDRADRNQTILDYLESASGDIESAIDELA